MSFDADDSIRRLVVYGCGPLAWSRWQDPSPETEATRGRLDEAVAVAPRVTVSLGEVLDRPWGWLPSEEPPELRAEIHRGEAGTLPVLPSWEELVARQIEAVTRELRGVGVLVTPVSWRENPRGRTFLRAWSAAGWQWAALEDVLRLRYGEERRFAVPGGDWLRLAEGQRRATLPNGAESALAQQLAEPLLDRLLSAVDSAVIQRWWQEEQGHSGWFVRQRIVQELARALSEGASSLELGTAERPLFAFSSPEAQESFGELTTVRLALDLPAPSATWWMQIEKPGFLRPARRQRHRLVPKWDEGETLVVEHPPDALAGDLAERPELQQLRNHLQFNGLPFRSEDPADLIEARDLATDLGPWLERRLAEDEEKLRAVTRTETSDEEADAAETADGSAEGEASATAEAGPQAIGDPLGEEAFDPRICHLDTPHRQTSVRVVRVGAAAGEPLPVVLREGEPGEIFYQIDDETLTHGSVIRVDYDPRPARPVTRRSGSA